MRSESHPPRARVRAKARVRVRGRVRGRLGDRSQGSGYGKFDMHDDVHYIICRQDEVNYILYKILCSNKKDGEENKCTLSKENKLRYYTKYNL